MTEATVERRRLPVLPVAALLQAQQTLTAVERFGAHQRSEQKGPAQHYRDLVPLERPRPGEQYAFDVDLDACTGCKACVAACHTLNGLDETELWRTVGLLHGGTPAAPAVQTVTTSCHHCVEPACLTGCPTLAYQKDAVTGIVRHLDDQCFGCEYCTLMCPYDAPKYNKARGIVRKCDMCSDRLAHGEAPACVQACPNEAISIQLITHAAVVAAADAKAFLPGVPTPEHTLPATVYRTKKALPNNMLPADFYRTSPEHSHPPLVVMLILTELSAGAFAVALLVERLSGRAAGSALGQSAFAAALAIAALGASVFHLGRPSLAWRAVLGWRTSWLSREAIAFGLYAALALLYAVLMAASLVPIFPAKVAAVAAAPAVQMAAALSGAVGVFCSVMVYVATGRAQWAGAPTASRFFGSAIVLGVATVLSVGALTSGREFAPTWRTLFAVVFAVTLAKVALEIRILYHRRDACLSSAKRAALVMLGELRAVTALRFGCAALGGLLLPLGVVLHGAAIKNVGAVIALMFVLLLVGELSERYLFFRAAPVSRMPGGVR